MDYEGMYSSAKRRYNNANAEISNYNRRINSLNSQKSGVTGEISQINASIGKIEKAVDQLWKMSNMEGVLTDKLRAISRKIDDAAINYSTMAKASSVSNKDLSLIYSTEGARNSAMISSIIESIRAKIRALNQKLEELRRALQTAQSRLNDINRSISSAQSALNSLKREKNNAYNDMVYYRKKINAQG